MRTSRFPLRLLTCFLLFTAWISSVATPSSAQAQNFLYNETTPIPNTSYHLRVVRSGAVGLHDRYYFSILDRDGIRVPNASFDIPRFNELSPVEGSPGLYEGRILLPDGIAPGLEPRLTARVGDQEIIRNQPLALRNPPPNLPGQAVGGQPPPPGSVGARPGPADGNVPGARAKGGELVPCGQDQPCTLEEIKTLGRNVFNFLLGLGAVAAVAAIVVGGFRYMTAHGDPGSLAEAKQIVMWAVIGLIVLLLAFAIVNTILTALGTKSEFQQ